MELPDPKQELEAEAHLDKLRDLPPADQADYLARLADSALREYLRKLLNLPPLIEALPRGFRCGDFILGEKLGEGGFGVVYRAEQIMQQQTESRPPVTRPAAVKFIRPELLRAGPAKANAHLNNFTDELARLVTLNHPHIVAVHAAGRRKISDALPEVPWFGMEYLDFLDTLDPATGNLRWPPQHLDGLAAKIEFLLPVCDAVAHAHRHNILHLDLSPNNIRPLTDGSVKVIDFGLAEWLRPERSSMPWRVGFGTPPYLAPEQLGHGGHPIGPPADVHALGVLLYQLITGRWPFDVPDNHPGGATAALCECVCTAPRRPLRELWQAAPRELDELLDNAMKVNPAARPPDAGAFRDALKTCLPKAGAAAAAAKHVSVHAEGASVAIGGNNTNSPINISPAKPAAH
jgi:serine/threonine protein kinase